MDGVWIDPVTAQVMMTFPSSPMSRPLSPFAVPELTAWRWAAHPEKRLCFV
jgi:hypothetical protein